VIYLYGTRKKEKIGKQENNYRLKKKVNDGPSFLSGHPHLISSHLISGSLEGCFEKAQKPTQNLSVLRFRPWDLLQPDGIDSKGEQGERDPSPSSRGPGGSSSGSWPRGQPWPPLPPCRWRRPHRLRPRPPPRKTSGVSNRDAPLVSCRALLTDATAASFCCGS
jgi:hypothetical protein